MALKKKKEKEPEYPSVYGSHKVMIDEEKTKELGCEGKVVCKDERGFYATDRNRLDEGLADPNRFASGQGLNRNEPTRRKVEVEDEETSK